MTENTKIILAACIGAFGGGVWTLDILLLFGKI